MKAVIHATGAIGEVLGIERRDGIDYVYFESGLCKPVSEVGFLNPYEQYEEDCYGWEAFRREVAKDFTVALVSSSSGLNSKTIAYAIEMADELIKQLKGERK